MLQEKIGLAAFAREAALELAEMILEQQQLRLARGRRVKHIARTILFEIFLSTRRGEGGVVAQHLWSSSCVDTLLTGGPEVVLVVVDHEET